MKIQENIVLAPYTTFRIGGNARYFIAVTTVDELVEAVTFAQREELSIFVLGGGSNILIGDDGCEGLVIRMEIQSIEQRDHSEGVEVIAGAGVNWDAFVERMVNQNLYGVENLSLIPGTVGASVVQNIGAYGVEVEDVVLWVEVFDTETNTFLVLQKEECAFEYRNSIFKKNKKYIVIRVAYLLKRKGVLHAEYKDVKEYLYTQSDDTPSLAKLRNAIVAIRTAKLPDLKQVGTAGSFFKNPVISQSVYESLQEKYPDIPAYILDDGSVKVPLGWILEHICHLKGVQDKEVGTYEKQSLVIVNHKNATAADVKDFANKIIKSVKEKTGIKIEKEVEYIF